MTEHASNDVELAVTAILKSDEVGYITNPYLISKLIISALNIPARLETARREAKEDLYELIVSDLAAKADTTKDPHHKGRFEFAHAYVLARFERFERAPDD